MYSEVAASLATYVNDYVAQYENRKNEELVLCDFSIVKGIGATLFPALLYRNNQKYEILSNGSTEIVMLIEVWDGIYQR